MTHSCEYPPDLQELYYFATLVANLSHEIVAHYPVNDRGNGGKNKKQNHQQNRSFSSQYRHFHCESLPNDRLSVKHLLSFRTLDAQGYGRSQNYRACRANTRVWFAHSTSTESCAQSENSDFHVVPRVCRLPRAGIFLTRPSLLQTHVRSPEAINNPGDA